MLLANEIRVSIGDKNLHLLSPPPAIPRIPAKLGFGPRKITGSENLNHVRAISSFTSEEEIKMRGGLSYESEHDLAMLVSDFMENGSNGTEYSCYSSDSESGFSDLQHLSERIMAMDEEFFKKFQEFLAKEEEKMKREGTAWQQTAKKKAKEETTSSSAPQGKIELTKVSTETKQIQAATAAQKGKAPIKQQEQKTFATIIAKDWYNHDLKTALPVVYERINGCFKAIQAKDGRSANYWLTQIERSVLDAKQRIDQLKETQEKFRNLVLKVIQYSSTSRSDVLTRQAEDLFGGTTTTQKTLKEIFAELNSADLINLRIQDFLEIVRLLHIENEKTKELEAEITVQNMINLYQQNLLEETRLLTFFQQLEDTNIPSLLEREELIVNKFERPRVLACFQDVPKYKEHLKKGLVHEIFINTNHPEEYSGYIPKICQLKVAEYTNRFQSLFMFRIWSVWEERQYIKFYPSIQLWELHRVLEEPRHKTTRINKKQFDEDQERFLAAKEFFDMAIGHATSGSHSVTEEGPVLLFDWLSAFEDSDQRIVKTIRYLENLQLGKTGTAAQRLSLEEWQLNNEEIIEETDGDGGMVGP